MQGKMAVLFGLVLLCAVASTVLAYEGTMKAGGTGMKGEMMSGGDMKCHGGMMCQGMTQMCPMHKMMESMAEPVLVATRDGGVVVMLGGKLYKYDRHLNLKEEAELKVGMGDMHRMMMHMGEKCPVMEKMMGEGGMMEGGGMMGGKGTMGDKGMMDGKRMKGDKSESPAPEPEKSEETTEHEIHH
ncbi:MAG: hypothetical protein ABIJ00_13775 [Candidatus Eisenbacteria bacterium]